MNTYQAAHDFSSGSRLQSVGFFHFVADSVNCPPTKHDGTLMPNAFLQVHCTVAAGTVPGCENKKWELLLWEPKPDNPDFGQRINDRALIALGVIDPANPGAAIEFNPDDLVGRQFIAHVEANEYNGKTNYRLAFGDIYHVDDPEAASYPKNEGMLKIIPPALRRTSKTAPVNKANPPKPKPAATPVQQAAAKPLNVDDMDI